MNMIDVTMVRMYMSERNGNLENLIKRLHDWEKVKGVTVFRGIEGFGDNGRMHTASLVDLSLDLPIVVEFFDVPEKVDNILEHLNTTFKPGHIVCWPARVNEKL